MDKMIGDLTLCRFQIVSFLLPCLPVPALSGPRCPASRVLSRLPVT